MKEGKYRNAEEVAWSAHGVTEREERFVEIPSLRTRVRVQLVGSGPPVLFVHGGPAAGTAWASLAARLTDHRCIVLDRPGSGLSPPVDYDQAALQEIAATVLAQTLEGLEVPQAHVVASSVGGTWALWFAQRHPERVQSIVQMSCPALIPEMDMKAALYLRLLSLPVIGAALARLPASDTSVRQSFRAMGHGSSLDAEIWGPDFYTFSKSMMSDTDVLRNERRMVQKVTTFWALRPETILDDDVFRSVPHRTHWFWGADDSFGTVAAAERMVSLMPDATLEVVEDSGHLPWLDVPDRAAASVRATVAAADDSYSASAQRTS